jgi:uncharacterized protein (TIGR03083 family)
LVEAFDYLAVIKRESGALAEAAAGNLERGVPGCPEWTVADLLWHMGEVHHFWGSVAEGRLQSPQNVDPVARPEDEDLIPWLGDRSERLVRVLEGADPSTPVWTWSAQKEMAFIPRRMAHETAVHRWDAQSATGSELAIDPQLAVDGIDEFLDLHLPASGDFSIGSESLHLHSTDAPGEWVIRIGGGVLEVAREHAKGDAAVRGPASDLLLLLWRRRAPSDVEVIGDPEALDRFLARPNLN